MTARPDRPIRAYVHHLYADRWDEACRSRYILVVFHPTAADLRAAAMRRNRRTGQPQPDDDYDDTCGMFQPSELRSRYDRKTKVWIDTTPAFAGVLRLALTHCTPEIVAHECTHAAIHVTRLHDWSKPGADGVCDLGDSCDHNEEAFAYLLGSMVHAVTEVVNKVRQGQRPAQGVGGTPDEARSACPPVRGEKSAEGSNTPS